MGGIGLRFASRRILSMANKRKIGDPSDLANLILWLDADDSTTITTVSTKVSQWTDKADGNVLVQGTDANRPTLSTAQQAGRNGLLFSGSQFLIDETPGTVGGGLASGSVGWCVFVVCGNSNGSSVRAAVSVWNDTDSAASWFMGKSSLNYAIGGISNTGTDIGTWNSFKSMGTDDTAMIIGLDQVLYEKNCYQDRVKWQDHLGGPDGAYNGSAALVVGDVEDNATFGLAPWSGHIYEIVVYNKILSFEDREALFDYFDRKWVL